MLKDNERVPTPSTIRSFSTDIDEVYENNVAESKPERNNGSLYTTLNRMSFWLKITRRKGKMDSQNQG